MDNPRDKFGDCVWINCGKAQLHAKIEYWKEVIHFLCSTYTVVFHKFFVFQCTDLYGFFDLSTKIRTLTTTTNKIYTRI